MPLHYRGRDYKSFTGLVAAIKRDHPRWSTDRCRRYAGGLRARQEKLGTYQTISKKSDFYR